MSLRDDSLADNDGFVLLATHEPPPRSSTIKEAVELLQATHADTLLKVLELGWTARNKGMDWDETLAYFKAGT